MAPVQKNMAKLTAEDRTAIAAFLKSLPPIKSEKPAKPGADLLRRRSETVQRDRISPGPNTTDWNPAMIRCTGRKMPMPARRAALARRSGGPVLAAVSGACRRQALRPGRRHRRLYRHGQRPQRRGQRRQGHRRVRSAMPAPTRSTSSSTARPPRRRSSRPGTISSPRPRPATRSSSPMPATADRSRSRRAATARRTA